MLLVLFNTLRLWAKFVWIHAEIWAQFLFDVPLRSKVTKELLRNRLTSCLAASPSRWLAVTAKRFWIWKSCLTHVFSLVWRSYMASFMMIRQNLWPVDMYYWFWHLSTWWPNSDVSMKNNWWAIWGGLTVSPDIEHLFEIYSCEERGVKTHID